MNDLFAPPVPERLLLRLKTPIGAGYASNATLNIHVKLSSG